MKAVLPGLIVIFGPAGISVSTRASTIFFSSSLRDSPWAIADADAPSTARRGVIQRSCKVSEMVAAGSFRSQLGPLVSPLSPMDKNPGAGHALHGRAARSADRPDRDRRLLRRTGSRTRVFRS